MYLHCVTHRRRRGWKEEQAGCRHAECWVQDTSKGDGTFREKRERRDEKVINKVNDGDQERDEVGHDWVYKCRPFCLNEITAK